MTQRQNVARFPTLEQPTGQELTVKLTELGVYGYIFVPHYEVGRIGLIIIRKPQTDKVPNFTKAKK